MSRIYTAFVSNYTLVKDRANEYLEVAKKYVENRLNDKDIQKVAKKVKDFVIKNKSLLFFFSTVLFSYAITSNATFSYLSKTNVVLHKIVLENFVIGSVCFIIGNILSFTEIPDQIDNNINYLAAIINLCAIYLSPIDAITTASMILGIILSKTFYRNLFDFPKKEQVLHLIDERLL
jgi:hypothetical protein